MAEELGLRERKKRETRLRIADIAMGLFMQRGFDRVTVAEVAEVADVSVNTVFNYFKTKEDLFFDRQDDSVRSLGGVVAARRPGESLVEAIRRDFHDALENGDWRYGVNDGIADFHAMVEASPSLSARMREMGVLRERYLAQVLAEETDADPDDPTPRLIAGQVCSALRVAGESFVTRRIAGQSVAVARAATVQTLDRSLEMLTDGIGDYLRDV